jgi:predicted metal-dependent peptidase
MSPAKKRSNLGPSQLMATARMRATKIAPYLSDAILGLIPHEAPGLGTMAVTDQMVLLYDPETVVGWGTEHAAWVLLHEASHPLRKHGERGKKLANRVLANVCFDCEINDDLMAMGAKLPDDPCLPAKIGCPDGKLAEEYYAHMLQQQRQRPQGGDGAGQGDGEEQQGDGQGGDKPKAGAGWCGSGAGRPVPNEPKNAQGRSAVDVERIRQQVAKAIQDHARGRGSVPGGWLVWADQQLKPSRVPWQQLLARAIRASVSYREGTGHSTYERPSRRQGAFGWGAGKPILCSVKRPVPQIAIGVDTSGSMGGVGMAAALSETMAVLAATRAEVTLIAADCVVQAAARVRSKEDVIKILKGGGGTDFRPAFAAATKLKARPGVFIFITDGEGCAPTLKPKGLERVIWVLVNGGGKPFTDGGGAVGWGEVIEIDNLNN